jgi:antitoxin VapB
MAMTIAQVTTENGHPVVHLPAEVSLKNGQVSVKQIGDAVILVPHNVDPWKIFSDCVNEFTPDFMQDRNQPPEQVREPLDE